MDHPASATALLVLGMHRSGTSAVARLLNLRGADLGRDLLPPKQDNERGFWENRELLQAHEACFSEAGWRWHDPTLLPDGWRQGAPARRFVAALPDILTRQFGAAPLYAVKDPRLSLLLPLWIEVLAARATRAAAVIVVRDPSEVSASLARRDGFAPAHSQLLWLQHFIDAERHTRALPRVFVHYERLLADWRAELARIGAALGIDWPPASADFEAQADAFIAPDLRHHRSDRAAKPPLPELVERAYLHASTAAADLPFAADVSDALAFDFDRVLQFAAPLYRDQSARRELAQAQHASEVEAARALIAAKDDELAQARTVHDAKSREIDGARAGIDALSAELALARDAGAARDAEVAAARAVIAAKDTELVRASAVVAAKDAELVRARAVVAAKDAELARARAVVAAKDDELVQARVIVAGKDVELAKAGETIAIKDREIAAARRNIDTLAAAAEQLRATIAAREREIDAARVHGGDLAGQLDAARDNIGNLVAQIDAARANIDALVGEIAMARSAHGERDRTEAALRGEIAALRDSRWFRVGRALRLLGRTPQ